MKGYTDILLTLVLTFIMFGVGLSITISDLRSLLHSPRFLFGGLFAQMILLPLLAMAIVYFAPISPALKVGFIILASCPGGTTSGFVTYLFKGNVTLSVSLTSVNSLLTIFTIPLLVNAALWIFLGTTTTIKLPVAESVINIFLVTILPAASGIFFRYLFPSTAEKIRKPIKLFMIILFAVVFLIFFLADENQGGSGITLQESLQITPFALLMNVSGFVTGMLIGFLIGKSTSTSFTIGIEASLHNTTLAFLVAGTLLHNHEFAKPALIYAMFSFWTALLYGVVVKWFNKAQLFGEFKT
jgi:bile acid:Na+ symporter, BASS family